jgi:hypothetical protein
MVHYFHPNILLRALKGMNSEVNLDEFRLNTGIESFSVFKQLLNF